MKKLVFKLLLMAPLVGCFAQIDANLLLGLTRATTLEMNAITGSIEGSLLYNTDEARMYIFDTANWEEIPFAIDLPTISGTQGSVFFADATGDLSENNNQLFWDATNNRLGIGTNTPTYTLEVTGAIRAPSITSNDGTALAPAYNFNSDTDTGVYLSAANQLSFSTGGVDALTLNSDQNIGVGTTSPTSRLETGGSFATAIDAVSGNITLDETHHTIINDGYDVITLPAASTCKGRMYIIKNTSALGSTAISAFTTLLGVNGTLILPQTVLWIQSDGTDWQQIQ